jgi:hypothetical protein
MRPRHVEDATLRAAAESAVEALIQVDGRASGLKFNKMMYAIHKHLAAGKNKAFHFTLPHRWYLYGAIVDARSISTIALFHHEDEFITDVDLVRTRRRRTVEGAREEIYPFAREFAIRFAGSEGIPPMLREHYLDAPLQFQRDFLEFSLLCRAILGGYSEDSPEGIAKLLGKLEASYPLDFNPKLTTAFNRLTLYLEPRAAQRPFRDLISLKSDFEALWDFWETFCRFLSVKYNEGIPSDRLSYYESKAKEELEAYERRLEAYLRAGYLRESKAFAGSETDVSRLTAFLAGEAMGPAHEGP